MSNSLRDQLLGLGFAAKAPAAPSPGSRPGRSERQSGRPAVSDAASGKDASRRRNREAGADPSRPKSRRNNSRPSTPANSRTDRAEMDLGKAYALRARVEKEERMAEERERQAAAQRKREAKAEVTRLLVDQVRNDEAADIPRHFEYGGRIRRVHVTAAQLRALNAGALGVVQSDGRYLLVDAPVVEKIRALLPAVIALMVDPAVLAQDGSQDPRFEVPDDLVW